MPCVANRSTLNSLVSPRYPWQAGRPRQPSQGGDTDIYDSAADPILLRSRVGMVFRQPNPSPTMSIYENVVVGLKSNVVGVGRSWTKRRSRASLPQHSGTAYETA